MTVFIRTRGVKRSHRWVWKFQFEKYALQFPIRMSTFCEPFLGLLFVTFPFYFDNILIYADALAGSVNIVVSIDFLFANSWFLDMFVKTANKNTEKGIGSRCID